MTAFNDIICDNISENPLQFHGSQSLLSIVNVMKFLILLAKQQRPTKPAAATSSSSSPRPGQNPPPEQVKTCSEIEKKKDSRFTIYNHSSCALFLPPLFFLRLIFFCFRNIRCGFLIFSFTFYGVYICIFYQHVFHFSFISQLASLYNLCVHAFEVYS